MRKIITLSLVMVLVGTVGAVALADGFKTPSEIFADLKGITVEEAYELRGNEKTFGALAKEEGVLDEFIEANVESKKNIIDERVKEGQLTKEEANELIKALEDCDGSGERMLGQKYGIGFGNGNGSGQGKGKGNGRGYRQGNGNGNRWHNNTNNN